MYERWRNGKAKCIDCHIIIGKKIIDFHLIALYHQRIAKYTTCMHNVQTYATLKRAPKKNVINVPIVISSKIE